MSSRQPIYCGRINYSKQEDEQIFVDHLVNFDRICVVGITNKNLVQYLDRGLSTRKDQGYGFWDEIRVIFLARKLLRSVLDYRCYKYEVSKAIEDRFWEWARGVREVREFFLRCGTETSSRWECLQFNYMLPFKAKRYSNSDGTSVIHIIPMLPTLDVQESYCIEINNRDFSYSHFSNAIDAIMRTATPIVEFNVYGHAITEAFNLSGVVSQNKWRSFKPPEGGRACFPVALVLLYSNNIDGVPQLLLQKRTIFNTGGDFDIFSLISGKVNDEDFFFPDIHSEAYRSLAYRVSNSGLGKMRKELSKMFAVEKKLMIGQPVSPSVMKKAWDRTAIRELNSELGLQVKPDRLKNCECPPLLNRGKFDLYVNLYMLELQPEELAYIQKVRPNANLEIFSLDRLKEYHKCTPTRLNHFLNINFFNCILPLVCDTIGVK